MFDVSTRAEARDCLRWFLTNFPTYYFNIKCTGGELTLDQADVFITIAPDRTITTGMRGSDSCKQTGFDYGGMLDAFRKEIFNLVFCNVGETFTSNLDYDLHILENGFVCFTPETSCVRGVYCEYVNGHFEEGGRLYIYMKGRNEPIIHAYRYWDNLDTWVSTFFPKLDVGNLENIALD